LGLFHSNLVLRPNVSRLKYSWTSCGHVWNSDWEHNLVSVGAPQNLYFQLSKQPTNKLTDWLTNFMEQSPSWESHSHSTSQEILRPLWNHKIHYRIHKSLHLYLQVLNLEVLQNEFHSCYLLNVFSFKLMHS
jgi:hypothetical protein